MGVIKMIPKIMYMNTSLMLLLNRCGLKCDTFQDTLVNRNYVGTSGTDRLSLCDSGDLSFATAK